MPSKCVIKMQYRNAAAIRNCKNRAHGYSLNSSSSYGCQTASGSSSNIENYARQIASPASFPQAEAAASTISLLVIGAAGTLTIYSSYWLARTNASSLGNHHTTRIACSQIGAGRKTCMLQSERGIERRSLLREA